MASIEKLLVKADQLNIEKQSSYELKVNKMYYLIQAFGSALTAGVLIFFVLPQTAQFSTGSSYHLYLIYAIAVISSIYAVLSFYAAFTAKVVIDDQGITIPGMVAFQSMKLPWDDVDRAELTSVITYSNYLILIVKKIFSSIFANIELRISYRSAPGREGVNFPVLDVVADRAKALRIIQDKLDNRFTVYQGEY